MCTKQMTAMRRYLNMWWTRTEAWVRGWVEKREDKWTKAVDPLQVYVRSYVEMCLVLFVPIFPHIYVPAIACILLAHKSSRSSLVIEISISASCSPASIYHLFIFASIFFASCWKRRAISQKCCSYNFIGKTKWLLMKIRKYHLRIIEGH